MGSLALAILGGYNQAKQEAEDKEYEDRKTQRSMIAQQLANWAGNEELPAAVRKRALTTFGTLSNTPTAKNFKFNVEDIFAPTTPEEEAAAAQEPQTPVGYPFEEPEQRRARETAAARSTKQFETEEEIRKQKELTKLKPPSVHTVGEHGTLVYEPSTGEFTQIGPTDTNPYKNLAPLIKEYKQAIDLGLFEGEFPDYLKMKGSKSGSGMPLDREQADLEVKIKNGTATKEEKVRYDAVKTARTLGQQTTFNLQQSTLPSEEQMDEWAQKIIRLEIAPQQVKSLFAGWGQLGAQASRMIFMKVGELDPNFNVAEADANYNFAKNQQTQNRIRSIDALTSKGGAYDILNEISKKVSRTPSAWANKPLLSVLRNLGGAGAVAAYKAVATEVGMESAFVLSMGGQLSDARVKLAADMIDPNLPISSLASVLNASRQIIDARKRSITSGTYMDEVPPPTVPEVGGGEAKPQKKRIKMDAQGNLIE